MFEIDIVVVMGVGVLVYKFVIGKVVVKVGFLVVVVIFVKKFWFIIFLLFVYGWKWIKCKFFGKLE